MASTGTLIGTYAHADSGTMGTVANGIDFSNYKFTGDFLKSANFTVDGSGDTTANSLKANTVTASETFIAPLKTPSSSTASCKTGQVEFSSGYVYVCVSTNLWKRAALASF